MVTRQFTSGLLAFFALGLLMPLAVQANESAYCGVLQRELMDQIKGTSAQLEDLEKKYSLYMHDYKELQEFVKSALCRRQNFRSFFRNKLTACYDIENRLANARTMLDDIEKQRDKLLGELSGNPNKKYILQLLGDNRCGTQYQKYARQNKQEALPDWLVNDRAEQSTSSSLDNNDTYSEESDSSNIIEYYSTVCVRSCDGYYFPISFATLPEYFDIDSEQCNKSCPLGSPELYTYKNSGETIENAISLWGNLYISNANAFAYRDRYIEQCYCNVQIR